MPTRENPKAGRGFVVCRDGEAVPPALRGAIVAIGNFDGVHRGHQILIGRARKEARARRYPCAILTFEPHPRSYFAPDRPMFRLTSEAAKLAILARLGVDGAFVWRFDAALAGTSAADFVKRRLAGEIAAAGVVVGHDFHFGRGREGTPAVLERLCREAGLSCLVVPTVEDRGAAISSSAIRSALEAGDIVLANALLGYRWRVEGTVRHGEKRGRTLGFPTANLALDPGCRLRHGIYAVRAAVAGGPAWGGVASFGRRPTFDDGPPLLETFLFGFDGDLYGKALAVEFLGWIRGEERFASAEALVRRMHEDADAARALLADPAALAPPSMIA